MKKKIYVLDTNVILHDYKAIYHFQDNDIVIPIIVLEELDTFKKGNSLINYHAREFMREIDTLTKNAPFKEGVSLGKDRGKLFIETGKKFTDEMEESFSKKSADHKILAVAEYYRQKYPDTFVALVTQDINLRMKAKSLGVNAEDYKTGKVENIDIVDKEFATYESIADSAISKLFHDPTGIDFDILELQQKPNANEFFILKGTNSSALATYDKAKNMVRRVVKNSAYKISPKNAEQTFAIDALLNPDISLISLTGKAGTGKTLLALAAAVQQNKMFEQILLARPIVPLSNKDMGFLPGDEKAKIGPYMQPLYDNLNVIKHQFSKTSKEFLKIEKMEEEQQLVITPLAYIRGRSLSKVFFIVDEAQNLTPHEVKTIITRAGENTKMVFTGDINQIDSPYLDKQSNGLSYLTDRMKDQDIFAHINLVKGERSYLSELASDLL